LDAFGRPIVVHDGARVEDLVDRFQAGDGSPRSRLTSAFPPRRWRT